jgi:hypothetical protein
MNSYINKCRVRKLLATICLLASFSSAPMPAPAAEAALAGNPAALSWDFGEVYDLVEDSAVRIESMGRVGSGVLRRGADVRHCEVITVHNVTVGRQQIGVTVRSGADYVGSLERADEQRQVDIYTLKDMPSESASCPSIKISQDELAPHLLVLGLSHTAFGLHDPRPLFGGVARIDSAPRSTGGDGSRSVAMLWMITTADDHGAGVYNSRGELVGLVGWTIPGSVGACLMEVGKNVQSAIDEAHKSGATKSH